MPIDQTFVIIGKRASLDVIFERIEQALLPLGFFRNKEILVDNGESAPDTEREVTLMVKDLTDDKIRLQGWRSIYMDFNSQTFSMGVQLDEGISNFIYCYIFIDRNKIYTFHKNCMPIYLYEMISKVAESVGAIGGYSGFEASSVSGFPEQILSQLLLNPHVREQWFDIHIVEDSQFNVNQAKFAWVKDFEPFTCGRFLFFVNQEFLSLCKDFG